MVRFNYSGSGSGCSLLASGVDRRDPGGEARLPGLAGEAIRWGGGREGGGRTVVFSGRTFQTVDTLLMVQAC